MFKRQLKNFLHEKKLTASELARRTGVPKQTISDWLAGTRPRNMDYVRRLAEELNVEITDLYFGKEAASDAEESRSVKPEENIDSVFRDFMFKNAINMLYRIVDLRTGFPIEVSDTWEKVIGWSREEMKACSWLNYVHEEDRQRLCHTVQRNIFMGAPVSFCDYRALHRNGELLRLRGRFAVRPALNVLMCISVQVDQFAGHAGSDKSDS
jgi:PAS domain S-box-containing protein